MFIYMLLHTYMYRMETHYDVNYLSTNMKSTHKHDAWVIRLVAGGWYHWFDKPNWAATDAEVLLQLHMTTYLYKHAL